MSAILIERAISLTQPWATLCAIGAKQRETRCWPTGYRGWIAIHATKGFPRDCQTLCQLSWFAHSLSKGGYNTPRDLPRGKVIAVVRMTDCRSTNAWTPPRGSREEEFGDYSEDRYSFAFEDVRRLREPFDCKGALGIWRLPRPITESELI